MIKIYESSLYENTPCYMPVAVSTTTVDSETNKDESSEFATETHKPTSPKNQKYTSIMQHSTTLNHQLTSVSTSPITEKGTFIVQRSSINKQIS